MIDELVEIYEAEFMAQVAQIWVNGCCDMPKRELWPMHDVLRTRHFRARRFCLYILRTCMPHSYAC